MKTEDLILTAEKDGRYIKGTTTEQTNLLYEIRDLLQQLVDNGKVQP